jgi:hypothetical protein
MSGGERGEGQNGGDTAGADQAGSGRGWDGSEGRLEQRSRGRERQNGLLLNQGGRGSVRRKRVGKRSLVADDFAGASHGPIQLLVALSPCSMPTTDRQAREAKEETAGKKDRRTEGGSHLVGAVVPGDLLADDKDVLVLEHLLLHRNVERVPDGHLPARQGRSIERAGRCKVSEKRRVSGGEVVLSGGHRARAAKWPSEGGPGWTSGRTTEGRSRGR